MIELSSVKSLSDLPESIRSLFTELDNGLALDETRVRTDVDVANLKRDKDKERDLANAARAELAKFKELGSTPDEIANRIAEAESRSGSSTEQTERIAALQRDLRKAQADNSTLKGKLDQIEPDYEKLKVENRHRKTGDALASVVSGLKNVNADRLLRLLKKDASLGLLELDESGEGIICKDGSKIEEYAMTTANDFGLVLQNTPGQSSGNGNRITPQSKQNTDKGSFNAMGESILDDDVASLLDK